ncbi:uncharacterized protein SCO4629-like [Ruditapes philippinarum]|uniref:uncharacterized protein SCO4629-like n=1 Tax=Ruditapes philippinarum TaxID=129788 RepID=UPI00295B05DB|nr:uncharacterized protein SCO4629-like [Ruditapes philippinarum]
MIMSSSIKKPCVSEQEIMLARVIWDYMKLNHVCQKSDVILCMCSYDIRVADKAASLFLQGMGDWLVISGNTGKLTENLWTEPEAIIFAERARQLGVSDEKIILETKSTNSGENVRFTHKILSEKKMHPQSFILVQKPYMERRAYATFMKQWPDALPPEAVVVTSPDIDLLDYPNEATGTLSDVISVIVGDLARIKLYEDIGFQIPQTIPDCVQKAYNDLITCEKFNTHMPL